MTPKVSVVMPTYNTNKKYLKQAINSILNQSYKEFEFIIIDDCSKDDYDFIKKNFNDPRIRLFKNEKNMGLAMTLNKGFEIAQGDFIVRMDSDDIAYKNRISKQLDFLSKNPSIDLVGCGVQFIGNKKRLKKFPKSSDEIKASLLFGSPLVHPGLMIRVQKIKKYNLNYNSNHKCEDYELWTRCANIEGFNFHNIPNILLKYRVHSNQITSKSKSIIIESGTKIRLNYISSLGIVLNDEEKKLFNAFAIGDLSLTYQQFIKIDKLLMKILEEITENNFIDRRLLKKIILNKLVKEYFRRAMLFKYSTKSYQECELIKENRRIKLFLKIISFFCYKK